MLDVPRSVPDCARLARARFAWNSSYSLQKERRTPDEANDQLQLQNISFYTLDSESGDLACAFTSLPVPRSFNFALASNPLMNYVRTARSSGGE